MAIRTRDEILNSLRERMGEDTSDETLSFIEDITDTLNDYETKTAENTNWKDRYNENDAEWRRRYKERFFGTGGSDEPDPDHFNDEDESGVVHLKTKYEELFSEGE